MKDVLRNCLYLSGSSSRLQAASLPGLLPAEAVFESHWTAQASWWVRGAGEYSPEQVASKELDFPTARGSES